MCTFIYERIYMKFLALHENAPEAPLTFQLNCTMLIEVIPDMKCPFTGTLNMR